MEKKNFGKELIIDSIKDVTYVCEQGDIKTKELEIIIKVLKDKINKKKFKNQIECLLSKDSILKAPSRIFLEIAMRGNTRKVIDIINYFIFKEKDKKETPIQKIKSFKETREITETERAERIFEKYLRQISKRTNQKSIEFIRDFVDGNISEIFFIPLENIKEKKSAKEKIISNFEKKESLKFPENNIKKDFISKKKNFISMIYNNPKLLKITEGNFLVFNTKKD